MAVDRLDPYQKVGARHLAGRKHALLADEMGLGKTPQAIRAAAALGFDRVLIIVPAIGRPMWKTQFLRWWNREDLPRRETQILTTLSDLPRNSGPVICSYEYATRNADLLVSVGPWQRIIIDEAHRLGGLTSLRSHAILGKDGLIHHTGGTYFLTGTPARNHAGELWPILKACGVTDLSYNAFISRYCTVRETKFGKKITGGTDERAAELRELLEGSGFMLRRRVEEVAPELPGIVYEDLVIEPGPVDLRCSPEFISYMLPFDDSRAFFEKIDGERELLEAKLRAVELDEREFAQLQALAPAISTLLRYAGMQKVHPILDLLKDEWEAGAYGKIVIFGKFRDPLSMLFNRLKDWGEQQKTPVTPMLIWGGTDWKRREHIMEQFRTNPRRPWLLASLDACAELVDFTAANHFIMMERSFVPSVNDQAARRLQRRGQTKTVFGRVAGLVDSADEHLARLIRQKTAALAPIFGARPEGMFEEAYCGV